MYRYTYIYVSPSIYISRSHLPMYLFFYLHIQLSTYLSIYKFFYPSIHLFHIYQSIYLSTYHQQTIISKIYIFSLYSPDHELNRPCLSPSELQLFLRLPCLMGVVLGSSTPEKSAGPGANSTHFPLSCSDNATCIGL